MSTAVLVLAAAFLVSCVPVFLLVLAARRRFAGERVITCPETGATEVVRVDAGHAAMTSLAGRADLRLSSCTRWPERGDCGQQCLAEIAAAPDGCLVRERLESWYTGARCCLCGAWFETIQWFDRKPGLRGPGGQALSWQDVKAGELPRILATHRPLCFNCLVAETFRERFPDRVLDDPRRPSAPPGGRTRPAA